MLESSITVIMMICDMGNGAEFFKAIALGGAKLAYETVGSELTVDIVDEDFH